MKYGRDTVNVAMFALDIKNNSSYDLETVT